MIQEVAIGPVTHELYLYDAVKVNYLKFKSAVANVLGLDKEEEE